MNHFSNPLQYEKNFIKLLVLLLLLDEHKYNMVVKDLKRVVCLKNN